MGLIVDGKLKRAAVREAVYNACVFPSDWTTENFMKTHNSRPYNPDLANTFFRAGYIESWGRGIQKIYEECDLIGAKVPEYSILGDDITVKFCGSYKQQRFLIGQMMSEKKRA